jgi:small-conductance mechanosensitive channel
MDRLVELLQDTSSVLGRLVTTAALVLVAVAVVFGRLSAMKVRDSYNRYYVRKATHYITAVLLLIGLAIVWRPFAWRIGVVLGLAAAGVAFAMQEVIGAFAGWISILAGRQFRVGDRIQMGGVRGDVLDVTPLRTRRRHPGGPGAVLDEPDTSSVTSPGAWPRPLDGQTGHGEVAGVGVGP